MDVTARTLVACSPSDLFSFVDDLSRYPEWIDLVHAADPVDGDAPTWLVELRASVGPLARSKRLRMIRADHDPVNHFVRFQRAELDGRRHSPWVLEADIAEMSAGSSLTMRLHYGGSLWTGGVMERVLADQISSGQRRLSELASPTR